MAQRIVIPKGTVNPGETSVIEIPHHYQASSVVIASPKAMNRSIRSMTSTGSPIAGPSHRVSMDDSKFFWLLCPKRFPSNEKK